MKNKFGTLTLIPTPIDEESPLEHVAKQIINNALKNNNSIFVIEELKASRRRWIHFGLDRSKVDQLELFNEHNQEKKSFELLEKLMEGKNIYLMSDGGMPAFCDPGQQLVSLCHDNKIRVTATPFCNSVILSLALSGFYHKKFYFEGSLPREKIEREQRIESLWKTTETIVLLDAPYRLKKLLEVLVKLDKISRRKIFLAQDLNSSSESLLRGRPTELRKQIGEKKKEFILVINRLLGHLD